MSDDLMWVRDIRWDDPPLSIDCEFLEAPTGERICKTITIRRLDDGPVNSDVLRLPLAPLINRAAGGGEGVVPPVLSFDPFIQVAGERRFFTGRRPSPTPEPGQRGRHMLYGDDHFLDVAETYIAAFSSPGLWPQIDRTAELGPTARAPVQFVADYYDIPKSTAAKWVARARDLGFLVPTRRGQAGGRLTDLAKQLIKQRTRAMVQAIKAAQHEAGELNPDDEADVVEAIYVGSSTRWAGTPQEVKKGDRVRVPRLSAYGLTDTDGHVLLEPHPDLIPIEPKAKKEKK